MAEVASAYVSLIPSLRGGASAIARQTGPAADAAGRDAGKRFGLGFKSIIGGLGLAAAGGAVVRFLNDSVGAASDLNETVNKSNVIFGKNASIITRWSKTSDTALGLSQQAAIDAAASYGDMFLQLGIGRDRATKMSKGVVKLAADLGSFNNLGTDDVLERIAGGFRGEYDALQKVIPNISAARVQQEALRQTHKKSVTDLTAAEKATATLAIIQHDGARAAGDFARTSGGLANSQKIQAAEVENLKAQIGTGLLPIQLKVTRFIADEAIPAISDFVTEMQDGTGAGGEFVEILKDTVGVGKSIVSFFNSLPGPVKKYGADLLIASVIIGKVNSGLAGMTSGLSRYITSLTTAETRQARVSAGLQGLGGVLRNVAGAGGMVLLADSADEAGTKVGALKGIAGGALSGAALGAFAGPPGAAVGAALGGLAGAAFLMGKDIQDAGNKTADTLPSFTAYTSTLRGAMAATTHFTRELAYEDLKKSGLLERTEKLGIADRDAVQASLGNIAARKRVAAALADAVRHGKNYEALNIADRLGAETTALESSRVEQLKKNLALAKTDAQAAKIQAKLDKLGRSNASPRIALPGADKSQGKLTAVNRLIDDVAGKHPIVKVDADTSRAVSKLQALIAKDWSTVVNIIPFTQSPRHRASGGPVIAGQSYIVGERRPELFVPSQNGRIVPQVPSGARATGSGVDAEQTYFRAFSRALAASRTVIMSKPDLEALDLLVGAA